jgi:large subunit ribosomal protein L9
VAQDLKAKLQAATVKLTVKAGTGGRLFGSVKTSDIADAVAAAGLGEIDKRKVEINTPIKATGSHEATVRLRDDIVATITLNVVAAK